MKSIFGILLLCIFAAVPLRAEPLENRTLVFTYTSPTVISAYNNQPIKFTVTRDGKVKGQVSVVGLTTKTTLTLHDDGLSIIRPYILNIYVAPTRGQPLPYPTFFPNPGPGEVTIQVNGGAVNTVFMLIDLDGFITGPMAAGFIF